MRRAKRLLTPANVLAGLALFFALGGTGWAGQVLGKSSVGSAQLKSNAVTSSKIANGAVTAKKLAAGVVGGVDGEQDRQGRLADRGSSGQQHRHAP